MAQKKRRGRPPAPPGSKTKPEPVVGARVPEKTLKQLEQAAARNKRSLSREIAVRLENSFGPYGTNRPDHIADLAEIVARLAQSIERDTRKAWDRDQHTRDCLISAFINMIDVYRGAAVGPTQVSVPTTEEDFVRTRNDPAAKAVSEVILSLLPQADIGSGAVILAKIYRRWERRRRRK
jgi:hypothetical protein